MRILLLAFLAVHLGAWWCVGTLAGSPPWAIAILAGLPALVLPRGREAAWLAIVLGVVSLVAQDALLWAAFQHGVPSGLLSRPEALVLAGTGFAFVHAGWVLLCGLGALRRAFRRADPLPPLDPDVLRQHLPALAGLPVAVAHDARVLATRMHGGERLTVGLALLACDREAVEALVALARAHPEGRLARAAARFDRLMAEWELAELAFGPWTPLYWGPAALQQGLGTLAELRAEAACAAAIAGLLNRDEAGLRRALAQEVRAASAFLRRTWTAIDRERAGEPVADLYAIPIDPRYAGMLVPREDLQRATGLDAATLDLALAADPEPAEAPAVPPDVLEPFTRLFTRRILDASLAAFRLHAAALGSAEAARALDP